MDGSNATEHFKAEYEGQGFFSFRKDGWPDYVTMGNGGNIMEGNYDCKNYISSDIFEGMRLFYENQLEIRTKRIYKLSAELKEKDA